MSKIKDIYAGDVKLNFSSKDVSGELVSFDGELFYKIANYDRMRTFFMSLTSDSDIWLFISSNGGLTAGRKNANHAIFPYYTDDKLADLSRNTGSKSIFIVEVGNKSQLWIPFSDMYSGVYDISRNLYKNSLGNKLIFEEINHSLALVFKYSWFNTNRFGIIKKSEIINLNGKNVQVHILDGIQNILPPGISTNIQETKSNLANAYKKSELRPESGIGIYCLSSNIVDRPEPSEALLATTVGFTGLGEVKHLLCSKQVAQFAAGDEIINEQEIRAEPGAYFVSKYLELKQKEVRTWYFVIDTDQSAVDIAAMEYLMVNTETFSEEIEKEIQKSTERLSGIISQSDGTQISEDRIFNLRHISNTLFNVMRGGIFANGYQVEKDDFLEFIKVKNRKVFDHQQDILTNLPDKFYVHDLIAKIKSSGNDDLLRFSYEYLPITFSRRHGDPSRPWNKFNIDVLKKDGSWNKHYEGNWRDIFQNWEALCYSFPEFTENIITIFLNASTRDGYNPYRITDKGIEWEVTDPADPWSFIGYWGDHQIIYLLKLLELSVKFHPGELEKFVNAAFYTSANVPYRIKDYNQIVENPYHTIDYDGSEAQKIQRQVQQVGTDGKLIWDENGSILKATLTEKLFIPLLTKLSNFVPEGGIWMNTQRPEWNDANNALVGHGLSMVTVYYIYRYLKFLKGFYNRLEVENFTVNGDLKEFFDTITTIFQDNINLLEGAISDKDRKHITDLLGIAGEQYRRKVYLTTCNNSSSIKKSDLLHFIDLGILYLTHTIQANRRSDHLYHAYNLLELTKSTYRIKHLYLMLEGQVAVLSSGIISPEDALDMLANLRKSELYRLDQNSYILYPDRQLSEFMNKAVLNDQVVSESELLNKLMEESNYSIVEQDAAGNYHFNPALKNANDLKSVLNILRNKGYDDLVDQEMDSIIIAYESVFRHHAFTGRSGAFFGYEGLGSIYWHMNSKLLLAVQEIFYKARDHSKVRKNLKRIYYEIRDGLGVHKSPEVYGAFPTDPYSHTPANKGAQQPGLTGQVKEDILCRIGELGVEVIDHCLQFQGLLLNKSELLTEKDSFQYYNVFGDQEELSVDPGCLAFTFCQVPIIYKQSERSGIGVHYSNGKTEKFKENKLSANCTQKILRRTGEINYIEVSLVIELS